MHIAGCLTIDLFMMFHNARASLCVVLHEICHLLKVNKAEDLMSIYETSPRRLNTCNKKLHHSPFYNSIIRIVARHKARHSFVPLAVIANEMVDKLSVSPLRPINVCTWNFTT